LRARRRVQGALRSRYAPLSASTKLMNDYGSVPLPLPETLLINAQNFISGLKDALRWQLVWKQVNEDARVRANVLKASFVQVVLLCSVFLFWIASGMAQKGLQAEAKGQGVNRYFEVSSSWQPCLVAMLICYSVPLSMAAFGSLFLLQRFRLAAIIRRRFLPNKVLEILQRQSPRLAL
jgi:hypothetical protein